MFFGGPTPGQDKMDKFKEVMGWVEDFIKPTGYVAGTDHMTVADIAWLATFRYILDLSWVGKRKGLFWKFLL